MRLFCTIIQMKRSMVRVDGVTNERTSYGTYLRFVIIQKESFKVQHQASPSFGISS